MERESDPAVASPWLVAWRTRHLVGTMLAAAVVLVGLTLIAMQADPNAVDLGATRWIQQVKNPAFQGLMYWVSWVGYSPQNLILPLVLAAPFAIRRLYIEAVWVLGSQAASLVVLVLKSVVHRARPSADLVGVLTPLSDPSFPSGHVVQYTTLFGVTFFLVYVLAPQSRLRTVALILLTIPIVLVGLSRLYLGQHWLSDVLGGYAVSVLLLVPYCWAYARWRLERRSTTGEHRRAEAYGQASQAPGASSR
jgi:undecaprenyl-diphosphatase